MLDIKKHVKGIANAQRQQKPRTGPQYKAYHYRGDGEEGISHWGEQQGTLRQWGEGS